MSFKLRFTQKAEEQLKILEKQKDLLKRLNSVRKALAYLEINPKHPSLKTHKYESLSGLFGREIFEAYAENNTPCAYRIFWYYGPGKDHITIVSITPHP